MKEIAAGGATSHTPGSSGQKPSKKKNLATRSPNKMVQFDHEGEKKNPHLIKLTFRVSFKENWRPKPPEHQSLCEWRINNEKDAGENRWKQTSHRNGQSVSTETTQLKQNNTTKHKSIHMDAATGSWLPGIPMWCLSMLTAQAVVRTRSIDILIFSAFLLQHRHNERPAAPETVDSRKLLSL